MQEVLAQELHVQSIPMAVASSTPVRALPYARQLGIDLFQNSGLDGRCGGGQG